MTAQVIHLPITPPTVSRHWLIFGPAREVKGCACGFRADPGDYGFGDSVADHLIDIGRNERA